MNKLFVALSMISALTCTPVVAAPLQNMFVMLGTCELLIVTSEDYTDTCNTSIMQTIYADGRIGFYIGSGGQERLFAFSGYHSGHSGNSLDQIIDRVIFSPEEEGGEAYSVSVQGACTYANPNRGPIPMRISCEATDNEHKSYRLEFLTDGAPPTDYL